MEERGSAPLALLVGMATSMAVLALMTSITNTSIASSRAQAAADAAALSGATAGEVGAEEAARRNGAILVSAQREGQAMTVEVETGGERATARAELR